MPVVTKSGIPIRNIWHMLLYAWELAVTGDARAIAIEDAPTLDALFAHVLIQGVRRQLRRGMARSYRSQERAIRGVRGRIDFTMSLRKLAFNNGQAYCRFHEFTTNEPRNQIIRSTFAMLINKGEFGEENPSSLALRHDLRRIVRDLEGIDLVRNVLELIGQQMLGRNDRDYRIMLNVCELLWRTWMPTEEEGPKTMRSPQREMMTLHKVYEKFVANFYRMRLKGWTVSAQVPMSWHAERESPFLPGMRADLRLRNERTMDLFILDTKFTPNVLGESFAGNVVFKSPDLYQMYTYLRTQEGVSEAHRKASGILLYPTVHVDLDEQLLIQGHPIRIVTVDLSKPWNEIECELLALFDAVPLAC
jgi:5-methylcytosine-specific restriction enzyme subunit McrC